MYQSCLNDLIKDYSTIEKYPVLGLYLQDPDTFFNEYLLIEEVDSISICKRDSSKILIIDKANFELNISNLKLSKLSKNNKQKLFSLGNIEVYKKEISL